MDILTVVVSCFILILVMVDYFIKGGLAFGTYHPVGQLMNIINMSFYLAIIVMSLTMLRFWYRRLMSPVILNKLGGISFYCGFVAVIAVYAVYGALSPQYSFFGEIVLRAGREAISFWIGVCFCSLLIRSYLIKSWEGVVMTIAGVTSLWFLCGLGSIFLPQIGDIGFWMMRWPGIGANTAYWFAMYIGLGTMISKILTGRQKLSASL